MCAAAVGCFFAVSGCQQTLEVQSDPPGALVKITDSGNNTQQGNATFKATGYFNTQNYTVEVDPTAAQADDYQSSRQSLTPDQYQQLSGTQTDKTLSVKLEERAYTEVLTVELLLDPIYGWTGQYLQERSFRDVSEQGGAVPTQIATFGTDQSITGMAISPDDQRLVFSATDFDFSGQPRVSSLPANEIHVPIKGSNILGLHTGGGGIEHITDENFLDLFPSFTPDAKFLLFCSDRRRKGFNDILRTGSDGRGGIANIFLDPGTARAVKPSEASDGTISYAYYPAGWRGPADVQIYTVGGPNQFPTQVANGHEPAISPDGKHIAYIGTDGNLWVVNADGSNNTQLTSGAPDILARLKASLSTPEHAAELVLYQIYELEGTGKLLLVYQPFSYPSWSPDGKRILYTSKASSDATGRPHDSIWIMDANGTNNQELTTNGSQNRFPVMSQDQKYIYFYSNRGASNWAIWRIPAPQPAATSEATQ